MPGTDTLDPNKTKPNEKSVKEAKLKADFLGALAGTAEAKEQFEALENEKRSAIESMREAFSPELKKELREAMNFQLVDAKGEKQEKSIDESQENAMDTFGSVRKGHGISSEDWPKVNKAFEKITELTNAAIKRLENLKRPDDKNKPVYDLTTKKGREEFGAVIETEVFTPLVREKILPETLVKNAYSEVHKLLKATFKNYKLTLKETEEERLKEDAEALGEVHSSGSLGHGMRKKAYNAKKYMGYLKEKWEGTEEDKQQREIVVGIAKAAWKSKKAFKAVTNMIPDGSGALPKGVLKQDKFLHPEKYLHHEEYGLNQARLDELGNNPDTDRMRLELNQQRQEDRTIRSVKKLGLVLGPLGVSDEQLEALGKDIASAMEFKDTEPVWYGKSAIKVLLGIYKTGKGIQSAIKVDELGEEKMKQLIEKIEALAFQEDAEEAVVDAIADVDAGISAGVIKAVDADAGDVFFGVFADQVSEPEFQDAAAAADAKKVIELFAAGIKATFEKSSPSQLEPLVSQFRDAGEAIAKAFQQAAGKGLTNETIKQDAAKAFGSLGQAAFAAVAANLGGLKATLTDKRTLVAIVSKSEEEDEEAQIEQLEAAEKELEDFERTLTLIDDTGVTLAEQKSIEVLIAKLKQDKETLKMVNSLAGGLTGVAGGSMSIANYATLEVTDVITGQVGSALKAAKLIVKLSVNITQSVNRWRLYYKFKKDLERSKKAVSSLSSTIQGFFNNKAEQCTFREMENALTAVQIAAAILGTVPEPITMAVGKTMGLVATAAEATLVVSEMIYNKQKLAEAWVVTKSAMETPGDRALGLKALRLNPTLGMHALAWAAVEKKPVDPIARMVFNSLGVNEETLATGASEKDLRNYLGELLDEDRKMDDVSNIGTVSIDLKWAPKDRELTLTSFFTVVSRAQRDATPQLRPGDEKAVLAALKLSHKDLVKDLETKAPLGEIDAQVADAAVKNAEALWKAFNDYLPKNLSDNGPHLEMGEIAEEFLKLAKKHRDKIREIALVNATVNNPVRATNELQESIDALEDFFGKNKPTPGEGDRENIQKLVDEAQAKITHTLTIKALKDEKTVTEKRAELKRLKDLASNWLTPSRPRSSSFRIGGNRSQKTPPPEKEKEKK
jgi:hypothetical protein